ncbi:prepilin-type N-terminal cleavage/methylation domain-containing protein [Luteolibacter sp. AS25]|uniref:prepilin-type N-terminal cleavage/methylation domain-containing protein n=1 Tax=Luteolibacter sp. AS25 TaxID=3135776 RepID=UPI00398B262A
MKNPMKQSLPKGFTLVELLVVIAIIAVLAAAGFAGGKAAMNKAKKVTAQATATSIAANIESFYSDYSALPGGDESDSTVYNTTSEAGLAILNILAAQDDNEENTRGIRYLTVKDAKSSGNPRDGATYNTNNEITGLYDPWGEPYYFQMDSDYDESLIVTPGSSGSGSNITVQMSDSTLRGKRSAVWSLGTDEGGEADASTIARTW